MDREDPASQDRQTAWGASGTHVPESDPPQGIRVPGVSLLQVPSFGLNLLSCLKHASAREFAFDLKMLLWSHHSLQTAAQPRYLVDEVPCCVWSARPTCCVGPSPTMFVSC